MSKLGVIKQVSSHAFPLVPPMRQRWTCVGISERLDKPAGHILLEILFLDHFQLLHPILSAGSCACTLWIILHSTCKLSLVISQITVAIHKLSYCCRASLDTHGCLAVDKVALTGTTRVDRGARCASAWHIGSAIGEACIQAELDLLCLSNMMRMKCNEGMCSFCLD